MARHFPDFLTAYEDYAKDNFAPDEFHEWVGRSILAGAVERKVTLKQGRIHHVPNIFVMLVSHPGIGKSTAIDVGTNLLEEMRESYNNNFRIIPNQITEPALLEVMKIIDRFPLPSNPNITLPQSAGYFYASEASASALQNTFGDFIAAMTAFYDCPKWFRKKTKGDGKETVIENSCANILAGATFNYLKTLVNETSVLGGFASRLIYVVSHERKIRKQKWGATKDFDSSTAKRLTEDLAHINKLIGPMKPDADWISMWETWQPKFDEYLIALGSEKLESIMSRKGTNLIKLSMLLSISESDSLTLTGKHFERAHQIVESAYKDNALIIASAAMSDKNSQSGLNQALLQTIKFAGGKCTIKHLKRTVIALGFNPVESDKTVGAMIENDMLGYNPSGGVVTILVDPDRQL